MFRHILPVTRTDILVKPAGPNGNLPVRTGNFAKPGSGFTMVLKSPILVVMPIALDPQMFFS
ncbi:hypothetical protein DPMN_092696 [Dreissena polymorpha]|uniref:Uncharacterized protein n=1 Tax=Dreissena polymorpha TaxID=45954 RepID=A0A9D4R156_DREPO|nr:hypothetical protein DPMN_092696 [Dreissena polymorpha]